MNTAKRNVILHDRDTSREAVLIAQPLEHPLRRVLLLLRSTFVLAQDRIDNRDESEFRHPSKLRDPRIDFFRGLALYMIIVDHVVGDPLARFTYQRVGFSDAAEIFVYLSGLACGIAYSRTLARDGWSALRSIITRRAARIYVFYALSGGRRSFSRQRVRRCGE